MSDQHLVQMTVYVNQTGQWPTPFVTDNPYVVVRVDVGQTLGAVAQAALDELGVEFEPRWLWGVAQPDEKGRRMTESPGVVIADDGGFRWTGGGLEKITVRELLRTYEEGWFDGDPNAILLEHMLGADGAIPGWDDFLRWLVEAGGVYGGLVAGKSSAKFAWDFIKARVKKFRGRGALTPYAFLDVVLAREAWVPSDLARLLQITKDEAVDLLNSLGYVRDEDSESLSRSGDSERGALRNAIIKDFLKRDPARKKKGRGKHL